MRTAIDHHHTEDSGYAQKVGRNRDKQLQIYSLSTKDSEEGD